MSQAPPEAPSALAHDLHALVGSLRRRLREEANAGDLTPSQFAVLRRLEGEDAMTATALARAEGVRPQSIGATIAALEEAGLVRGEPHPTDRRQVLLSLTPECRARLREGRAAREDWLSRAIETRLAPLERTTLAEALELLRRLTDA